jgi:hypothetical protein
MCFKSFWFILPQELSSTEEAIGCFSGSVEGYNRSIIVSTFDVQEDKLHLDYLRIYLGELGEKVAIH